MSGAPTVATASRVELLERLRELIPKRGMTTAEAQHVAERQAELLLREVGVKVPAVPHSLITELPFLSVAQRSGFPTSGMAAAAGSGWVIVLRADEPLVRKRFSLLHELKHVIDDPFIDGLYPRVGQQSTRERTERVCDYFAGCVLMPKRWLVRDWCRGRQNIDSLARRYHVSRPAMRVRLSQLGLLPDTPRCLEVATEVAV